MKMRIIGLKLSIHLQNMWYMTAVKEDVHSKVFILITLVVVTNGCRFVCIYEHLWNRETSCILYVSAKWMNECMPTNQQHWRSYSILHMLNQLHCKASNELLSDKRLWQMCRPDCYCAVPPGKTSTLQCESAKHEYANNNVFLQVVTARCAWMIIKQHANDGLSKWPQSCFVRLQHFLPSPYFSTVACTAPADAFLGILDIETSVTTKHSIAHVRFHPDVIKSVVWVNAIRWGI